MSSDTTPRAPGDATRLPEEFIQSLTKPFAWFLRIQSAAGAILLVCAIAAVVIANSAWAAAFSTLWETPLGISVGALEFSRSLREWINDGLMTLFFFVVALELKRELVLGELGDPRTAALSVAAALGGMVVPAALFLALQSGHPGVVGWGAVMATDTAFVIGCLALLGSRLPQSLRLFMLSLAIVDDVGAIVIVAVGYSDQIAWISLGLAGVGCGLVRGMALAGIRSVVLYALVGIAIWTAVDASGLHATITGVVLGLLTPARRWVDAERLYAILGQAARHAAHGDNSAPRHRRGLRAAETATRESQSPVERLEVMLHPWVGFVIMPLFAFANAGVPVTWGDFGTPVALAVFVGLVLGKPTGVVLFTWLAVRSGLASRPPDLTWRHLTGGGLLAGIGFTMALLITNLAFPPELIDEATLGVFSASLVAALAGLAVLATSPRRRPLET